MPSFKRLLVIERKPAASGYEVPVGGTLAPVDILQLVFANLWWVFLLAVPIVIYFAMAKYGYRMPRLLRMVLRLIPIVNRTVVD